MHGIAHRERDTAAASPTTRHRARLVDPAGIRDVLPVIASVVPFGIILGVTIAQSTVVPTWAGVLSGPVVYAGSATLAVVTLLDGGAGLLAAVATAIIINSRVSIYGAALEPRFAEQPRWFRLVAVHTVIDQTYAMATARPAVQGRSFRRYWLTIGGLLCAGWSIALATGALLGPVIPADSPLDFAVPACFIGLVMPHLGSLRGRTAAAIAAGVAVLTAPMPNGTGLLVAVLAGLVPALLRGDDA